MKKAYLIPVAECVTIKESLMMSGSTLGENELGGGILGDEGDYAEGRNSNQRTSYMPFDNVW